jgi:uncharacterized membrane protein
MNPTTLKRWLIASLVFNLFLACGIAGGAWRWWHAQQTAATAAAAQGAQARGLRFAADELTPEQRKAFRMGLRDTRRDAQELIAKARENRQEVLRLLTEPQFDSAAATAALTRTRETDIAIRARVEAGVVAFAATLPPEDRAKFAQGLARRSTLVPQQQAQQPPQKP